MALISSLTNKICSTLARAAPSSLLTGEEASRKGLKNASPMVYLAVAKVIRSVEIC